MAIPEFKQEAMRHRSDHESLLRSILDLGIKEGSFGAVDPGCGRAGSAFDAELDGSVVPPRRGRQSGRHSQGYLDLLIGGIARKP
jgi:hypothetical protein